MSGLRETRGRDLYGLARTTVLAAAALLGLWELSGVVLIIFCALLVAIALGGLSAWLRKVSGLPYGLVLAALAVTMLLLAAAIVFWIGPELLRETQDLAVSLSVELARLHRQFARVPSMATIAASLNAAEIARWHVAGSAVAIVHTSLDLTVELLVIAVAGLYVAISPEVYVGGLLALVPHVRRRRVRTVLDHAGHVLRWWLFGQGVDMLIVGGLSSAGLLLVGEPAPLALGTLAGLLTFVPYFDALAASVPAILVALTVGPTTALWVAGVFLICHLIEGYIVSPLIQNRAVHLPPAISLMSMTVMGALFGPLGLVLATPLAATILVLVQEFYVVDVIDRAAILDQSNCLAQEPVEVVRLSQVDGP